MGAVRVEIYRKTGKFDPFAGKKSQTPLQTSTETTNNATPTTAGSRITVAAAGGYNKLFARVTTDTLGYVAIGTNPTADKTTNTSWRLMVGVAEDFPVSPGDKFSFIDN